MEEGRRALRPSSMRRLPGRYQEDLGPVAADRPLYVHPDVPFVNRAADCAFPSLPLNFAGVPPSEVAAASRAAAGGEGSSNGGRSQDGAGDDETAAEIPGAAKFVVLRDMTNAAGSFAAATRQLALNDDEIAAAVELAKKERQKAQRVAGLLAGGSGSLGLDTVNQVAADPSLQPINCHIGKAEVGSAKAYLRFLGHHEVAGKLGWWVGSGGAFHDIPIDFDEEEFVGGVEDAGAGLFAPGGSEVAVFSAASNDGFALRGNNNTNESPALDITGRELIVLMDPPSGTLNPRRLSSGAGPLRSENNNGQQALLDDGLPPANFAGGLMEVEELGVAEREDLIAWEPPLIEESLPVNAFLGQVGNSHPPNEAEAIQQQQPVTGELGSANREATLFPQLPTETSPREPAWFPETSSLWENDYFVFPWDQQTQPPGNQDSAPQQVADNHRDNENAVLEQSITNPNSTGLQTSVLAKDSVPLQTEPAGERITIADSNNVDTHMKDVSAQSPGNNKQEEKRHISFTFESFIDDGETTDDESMVEDKTIAENSSAPSQATLDAFTSDFVVMAQSPAVQERDPELAASVTSILARYTNTVHFADSAPASARQPAQMEDDVCGDEDELAALDTDPQPACRGGGRRSRSNDDDHDYVESRPRKSGVRKRTSTCPTGGSTPKRPRTAAAAPRTPRALADPKAPRRGPGRPRRKPLSVQPPTNTGTGKNQARIPGSSVLNLATSQNPIVETHSNLVAPITFLPPLIAYPDAGSMTAAASNFPPAVPSIVAPIQGYNMPTNIPATQQNPTAFTNQSPFKASTSTLPMPNTLSSSTQERHALPTGVPASLTPTVPLTAATTELPALTKQKPRVRKLRAPKDPNAKDNATKLKQKNKQCRSTVDPNARMTSSIGEEMTHGQLLEKYPIAERRYIPGGKEGGGRWEIRATGVLWSFVSAGQRRSVERQLREKLLREQREREMSEQAGGATVDEGVNPAAATAPIVSTTTILGQIMSMPTTTTMAQPVSACTTFAQSTPTTTTMDQIMAMPTTTIMTEPMPVYTNTFPHPAPTTTTQAQPVPHNMGHLLNPSTPTIPTITNARNLAAAQHIAEIDVRCQHMHVGKRRSDFSSDAAFLEWTERYMPLLYPGGVGRPGPL
ncbi:hypothetical protein N0V88_005047 [Collariella sp. IMI 366227]|nr:hypothetical protein N0V88_005047 [Collariella sp. IMI 366227]